MRSAITAFIAGGLLLFLLPQVPLNWEFICLVAFLLCLFCICLCHRIQPLRHIFICITLFVLGFAWNANYADRRLQNILSQELEGKEFIVEGRVVGLAQTGGAGAKFPFVIDDMLIRRETRVQFPKQVYLSWQPAWRSQQTIPEMIPGQRWKLKVKLKRPYGSLNPYTFDFERWAFHHDFGASGSVQFGELLQADGIGLNEFQLRMERARHYLRKKIQSALPSDARYVGVIVALVMGDQNAIHQEDWGVFNATGIGHLISISGLHVTMLAGVGSALAAFFWRRGSLPLRIPVAKVAAFFGFLTAFVYAWLAGFQIPAQRTMYMVGVVAFALWTGRNPRSFDIWWWALAFVLVIDPMAPYTPGFWLSFGAVAAILYAMKDSSGLLGIPTGKELEVPWASRVVQACREACRVQAVVTIALLPITLFWFYQASMVSPLANAFAIPIVSYIVTPLAIAGALLPEFIGQWLLLPAHTTMECLAKLLAWLASWNWSVVWSSQPTWWLLAFSALGMIYAIQPGDLLISWRSRLCALTPTAILFMPWSHVESNAIKPGEFKAIVLDIGQGTAVLIETANKRLLYDTGPIQGKHDDAGQRTILPYLRGRGIHQIDRMVISHSDSDHVGGASSLLKHISFGGMMGSLPSDNPLLKNLKTRKIPSFPCRYGQRWLWDNVEFVIWHPHESTHFQKQYSMKPNEMSCVLEVRNKSYSFWLTGDVERQGEAQITERLASVMPKEFGNRQLIFMAPHHGSKTSSSIELVNMLKPDFAFAQNGYRNRYGHPHPTVTARYEGLGIPFYLTPETGAQIWSFRDNSLGFTSRFMRWEDRRLWHRQ